MGNHWACPPREGGPMNGKRKRYTKTVEAHGVRVRVYERIPGGILQREVRWHGRKDRASLGHTDRALALRQAETLARRFAERMFAGETGPVSLGLLFRLYFEHRAPLLSPA